MLVEACRKRTPEALAVVESLMRNSSNDRVRLAAAQFIIERGWGKAPERYEITGELNKSVVVGMLGVDLTPEQAYIVIPSIQRI